VFKAVIEAAIRVVMTVCKDSVAHAVDGQGGWGLGGKWQSVIADEDDGNMRGRVSTRVSSTGRPQARTGVGLWLHPCRIQPPCLRGRS
jgi:hypothetical protein